MLSESAAKKPMPGDRNDLIARLRELIEALELRVPHLEREGEVQIAQDAAALKRGGK